jgi:hypothetical protein
MADKKVERPHRGHSVTPSEKLTASLSDQGLLDMADRRHDKGKAALVDNFREREERWRRDQSAHVRETGAKAEETPEGSEEVSSVGESLGEAEGGAR